MGHIPHLNPRPQLPIPGYISAPPIPGYIALPTILNLPLLTMFWSDTIWAPANNVPTLPLAPGQPGLAL